MDDMQRMMVNRRLGAMSVKVTLTPHQWAWLARNVHRFTTLYVGPYSRARTLLRAEDYADKGSFKSAGLIDGPLSLTVPATVLRDWLEMVGLREAYDVWWPLGGWDHGAGEALTAAFDRVHGRAVKSVTRELAPWGEPTPV